VEQNIDISHLSGYKTPATARYFVSFEGDNIEEVRAAVQFIREMKLPILTIAGGRNSLLAFDEYPGLVIYNASEGFEIMTKAKGKVQNDGINSIKSPTFWILNFEFWIKVASGQSIWDLAEVLERDHGIDIWHRFQGLPGSVGGAVFGNAGCFWLEIGPYVSSVEILDMNTGEIVTRTGEELHFDYRWSECKNHPEWFILSVEFDLSELREKYSSEEEPLLWRERVQPEGLSCGSFFKNPSREQSAGSLIESVWLKWYHHGWAYFSEKHANFLMSDGTATWQELIELIEMAQKKVQEQCQIILEPEVRIISW
jgi:UDP-N-acetylmuramate dehydrogenase